MKEADRKRSPTPDYLCRMGLTESCSLSDVTEAYRRRARTTHPDHGGSKEAFQLLREDYEKAKRYVHAPHQLRPPILPAIDATGLNPSVNAGANAKRHSELKRLMPILAGTFLASLTAFVGFFVSPLPLPLSVFALLVSTLGWVYLFVAELPKLPTPLAAILFATYWMSVTTMLLVLGPDIKQAVANPVDMESAVLPLLASFAYVLVTIFGVLGVLVSLVDKT